MSFLDPANASTLLSDCDEPIEAVDENLNLLSMQRNSSSFRSAGSSSPSRKSSRKEIFDPNDIDPKILECDDAFGSTPYRIDIVEYIKLAIGACILLPIRLLIWIPFLLLNWAATRIVCLGYKFPDSEIGEVYPMPRWRRMCVRFLGRLAGRMCMYTFGYYYVSVDKSRLRAQRLQSRSTNDDDEHSISNASSLPCIIVSNHVSYLDIAYFVSYCCPSFVAKSGIEGVPVVGYLAQAYQCIFINRSESKSGSVAKEKMRERLTGYKAGKYPPLLICPEGTTTNGTGLIQFRHGAFLEGLPVSPVVLRYKYHKLDPCYGTIPIVKHLLLMLCQFYNSLEVIWLPIYYPNEDEINDPSLYASNVRREMIKAFQGRDYSYTNSDKFKFERTYEAVQRDPSLLRRERERERERDGERESYNYGSDSVSIASSGGGRRKSRDKKRTKKIKRKVEKLVGDLDIEEGNSVALELGDMEKDDIVVEELRPEDDAIWFGNSDEENHAV